MQKNIILSFFIKSIITSSVCFISLVAVFSQIVFKLDLDDTYLNYISIIIVLITSVITAFISTKPFKNSGGLMGVISSFLIITYELFTLVFGDNSFIFFTAKLFTIIISSFIIGYISTKKSRKIRV